MQYSAGKLSGWQVKIIIPQEITMKKTALALATALLLLTACDSASTDGANAGGAGAGGINGTGAQVIGSVDGREVTDRVFFALDSSVVDSEGQAVLDGQAAWLKANSGTNITLEGHADERGTREYNIALGAKRAQSVRSFLASRGIDPSRMRTISYGKERPVAVCNDISCWSQNRRAVTVLNASS